MMLYLLGVATPFIVVAAWTLAILTLRPSATTDVWCATGCDWRIHPASSRLPWWVTETLPWWLHRHSRQHRRGAA